MLPAISAALPLFGKTANRKASPTEAPLISQNPLTCPVAMCMLPVGKITQRASTLPNSGKTARRNISPAELTMRQPVPFSCRAAMRMRPVGKKNAKGVIVAKLWKNGAAQHLAIGTCDTIARSVHVSGGDVYVAGWEINRQKTGVARLWKNGAAHDLTDGSYTAYAFSVFVSDNNVYVAGYASDERDDYMYDPFWKNGVAQNMSDGRCDAVFNSVFASDGDVYAAGTDWVNHRKYYCAVWKNSLMQVLSRHEETEHACAECVYVSGGDVYVAGYDGHGAIVWKNGATQRLAGKGSRAYCVFVQ
jgi:hypothetical protein